MSDYEWLDDELRAALADADPVPPHLLDATIGLADWIDPDASLAELVEREAVALRDPSVAQFEFEWDDAGLTVQLSERTSGLHVVGLFSDRFPDTVEIVGPELDSQEATVEHGSFDTDIAGTGAFVVRFEMAGARFVTPWLRPRRDNT